MPDPLKQTISASEAPALWNASPYITRWMLWQRFANGVDLNRDDDPRKSWGRKLQPLIIRQVEEEKKLVTQPNSDDTYHRSGLIGCTRDADIFCPDRGPGSLEIKCVFDYKVWAQKWQSGEFVPREYEIQLQAQMYVGDGGVPHKWGIVAVWVCADLYYFERRPIPKLWADMERKAAEFMRSVEAREEPDAFGALCEAPLIAEMFQLKPGEELDLSNDPDHVKTSEDVSMYQMYKDTVASNKPLEEQKRLQLLALAKSAEFVKLPCGVSYRVKKSGRGKTVVPYVPEHPLPPPPPRGDSVLAAG